MKVKNNTKVKEEDVRSLLYFCEDYPMAKTILLYQGKEKIRVKNVICLPCGEFLLRLMPDTTLNMF